MQVKALFFNQSIYDISSSPYRTFFILGDINNILKLGKET